MSFGSGGEDKSATVEGWWRRLGERGSGRPGEITTIIMIIIIHYGFSGQVGDYVYQEGSANGRHNGRPS